MKWARRNRKSTTRALQVDQQVGSNGQKLTHEDGTRAQRPQVGVVLYLLPNTAEMPTLIWRLVLFTDESRFYCVIHDLSLLA